jgi:hypothetical protein
MAFNLRPSSTSFRFLVYYLLVITAFIIFPKFSLAVMQVTLAWDENSEPDVAGYSLYAREAGKAYSYRSPECEGSNTYCTVYNLMDTVDYCFVVRAYDTDGNESPDSNEICLTNVSTNQGPIADAGEEQNVEPGAVVSLNGSNSIDSNDGIASYLWDQVDGPPVELSYDPLKPDAKFTAPSYVVPDGVYLIFELTVIDTGGLQSSDTCTIFVKATESDQPANDQTTNYSTIHIGDMEDISSLSSKNKWNASVKIEVHDNACNPVSGVTVNGTWSGGYSGSGSCITTQKGICSMTSRDININKTNEAEFTIQNIYSPKFTYNPAENHDPDEDSDGFTITVSSRP